MRAWLKERRMVRTRSSKEKGVRGGEGEREQDQGQIWEGERYTEVGLLVGRFLIIFISAQMHAWITPVWAVCCFFTLS